MTPVICLSDGYLGNGAEPWRIPDADDLPPIPVTFAKDPKDFQPYSRDPKTLARPWAIPGTPGLEHRIGGLEKQDITGNINYEPDNHDLMIRLRASKIERIADDIPEQTVDGPATGDVLLVGWGSTYGSIKSAVTELRAAGRKVSYVHLRHLNPFPRNLGALLASFKHVMVPEINSGQLIKLLRARYQVNAVGFNAVRGLPLRSDEIENFVEKRIGGNHA
jgi:2-oxoglutarate ferredoxin oxidoreductase subunit alpha